MTMQYDVKAAHITGVAGTLYAGPTRLKGLVFLGDATAGDIEFRDGGVNGPTRLQFNIPANSNNVVDVIIPGEGIKFNTSIYVVMPSAGGSSVTIFYG
jgi:hypothetical protein